MGRSIRVAGSSGDYTTSQAVLVVGIVQVPAARRTDSLPMIYYPSPLDTMPARTLYVRFGRNADEMIPLLHGTIRELNADVPRPTILTAEAKRWERQQSNQYLAAAVSLLGVLALLLSAGGLYGVVAFVVTMRSHEIAVRMAVGADARTVVRMIVRQSLRPAVIGAGVGALGAAVLGMIVRSRLYGASPGDPVAFGGATAVLLGVLIVASALPARRAARIEPIQVLRTE